MSDVAGAAPAAAEGTPAPDAGAPIDAIAPSHSNPLGSQTPPATEQQPEPQKAPSLDEAISRANEKVKARQAEKDKAAERPTPEAPKDAKTPEPKVEAKAAPVRADDGKFAPRDPKSAEAAPEAAPKPSQFAEPPSRFSNDGKAAWQETPEPVRAEVHRAVRELEQGIEKHRADAQAFSELKEFDDLAKQSGTTMKAAMANYVGIEQALRKDPVGGVEKILSNMGISLRDFAAHVLGQPPEAQASRQDATINELRQHISRLEQQVGTVSQTFEQQRAESAMSQVNAFMAEPGHERFADLSDDIRFFLETGRAVNLSEAYQMADRLNPGQPQASITPPAAPATVQPLNPAGQKSITGAPSHGSDPSQRKGPAPSIDEALKRAFAKAG